MGGQAAHGYFDSACFDANFFDSSAVGYSATKANRIEEGRKMAEKTIKSVKYNYYRFKSPIISPICQQHKPLPPETSMVISFKRSNPKIALIQLESSTYYNTKNIEIMDAKLCVTYVRSTELERKFSIENPMTWEIEDYQVRTNGSSQWRQIS